MERRATFIEALWPALLAASTLLVLTGFHPDTRLRAMDARVDAGVAVQARPVTNQDAARAQRLYNRVMQEFRNKDYEAALAGFRFFMALHANSHLAPSAQYWIGECEFHLERYEDAITSFSRVLAVSQQRRKLASATLKMGLAYRKLGQAEAARVLLERVLAEYPDTPEMESARKHLGALDRASLELP